MSLFNNHARYEALVTEHLDGLLDEAGEATLREHLATCAECSAEVADQKALLAVLHAEPMVEAPRSFALPYASRTVEAQPVSHISRLLRSMQMATAAAALVLVFLVGINIVEGPGGLDSQATDDNTVEQLRMADSSDGVTSERQQDMGFSAAGSPLSPGASNPGVQSPESLDDAPPQVLTTPAADDGRNGLEWALIGMSGFTAVLALAVVAATWIPRSPV